MSVFFGGVRVQPAMFLTIFRKGDGRRERVRLLGEERVCLCCYCSKGVTELGIALFVKKMGYERAFPMLRQLLVRM